MVKQPSDLSLIEDSPSNKTNQDLYKRTSYAKRIVTHIEATSTSSSFGIGIIGTWGSGKTNFLFRLRDDLKNNKQENIVFEFNPWKVKSDAIVEEFFKTLSNQLKPFNRSIHSDIKEYSKRILQTGKEAHFRLLDSLINSWSDNDTIEKKQEDINTCIKLTGKRIIVLIDDVDRLSGKETMEVLRIIRNTANFANTFFIVGLDQQYLVDVIANTKDFANEREYLKKIFQLTITLPAAPPIELIVKEAKNLLILPEISDNDRQIIDALFKTFSRENSFFQDGLDHKDCLFENYIKNIRDLKRFCNSFKMVFAILKDECDNYDLFILELIRNKNIDLYDAIRNKNLIDYEYYAGDNKFSLKKNVKENFKLSDNDFDLLQTSIDSLGNNTYNQRSFSKPENFHIYFSYQLFDRISLKEYNDLLDRNNAKEIYTTFNQWIDDGKYNELYQIFRFYGSKIFTKEKIVNIVIVWCNIKEGHRYWLEQATELLYEERGEIIKNSFNNEPELYKVFLLNLISSDEISDPDKAYILNDFISDFIQRSKKSKTITIRVMEMAPPGPVFKDKKEIYQLIAKIFENNALDKNSSASSLLKILSYLPLGFSLDSTEQQIFDYVYEILLKTLRLKNELLKELLSIIIRPIEKNKTEFEIYSPDLFGTVDFQELLITTEFTGENSHLYHILKTELLHHIPIKNKVQSLTYRDTSIKTVLDILLNPDV